MLARMTRHLRPIHPALLVAAAIAAAACSGGGGGSSGPTGSHTHYVIDSMTLPATSVQSSTFALDLDGDGNADNALGNLLTAFVSASSIDVQSPTDLAIVQGDTILLGDLQATSLTSAKHAGFRLYEGANPNPAPCVSPTNLSTCGQHLQGTGTFDVAAGTDPSEFVEGNIVAGTLDAGPGKLHLIVSLLGVPLDLHLQEAKVHLGGITATAVGAGVLGGAIAETDIHDQFFPGAQVVFSQIVGRDCTGGGPPQCGCLGGTPGAALIGIFDTDHDCAISLAEVQSNGTFQTLLAPDLDVDGDGTAESLSAGVGFTAVSATFTQP